MVEAEPFLTRRYLVASCLECLLAALSLNRSSCTTFSAFRLESPRLRLHRVPVRSHRRFVFATTRDDALIRSSHLRSSWCLVDRSWHLLDRDRDLDLERGLFETRWTTGSV